MSSFTFTITAENPCRDGPNGATRAYVGPALADFTYNLRTAKDTKTWDDTIVSSTEDSTICGAWSYTLKMGDDSVLDVRAFSSQLPGTKNFAVESSIEAMIGDHTIKLTAW